MGLSLKSTNSKGIIGSIDIPGDKSISHRAIICGSIAQGATTINGILESKDCLATLKAFEAMGVVSQIQAKTLTINGVGKRGLNKPWVTLDCGNSATSMRLLAGILTGQSFETQLTGDESLLKRPMERLATPLMQMGANIKTHDGKAPLSIHPSYSLKSIEYILPQASAQVKSAILFASLYTRGETKVIEPAVSRDHSEKMLVNFGWSIEKSNNIISSDNSKIEGVATTIDIPGDLSSAAFFIVAATIIPNSNLWLRKVGINPTRTGIITVLKQMGANIEYSNICRYQEELVADIHVRSASLTGIKIKEHLVSLAIDEWPIICIAAANACGKTIIQNVDELRYKESDRIKAITVGLQTLGVDALSKGQDLVIEGGIIQGGRVDSYCDHRIAMSFVIAGLNAIKPVIIDNCDNIVTSFPNFLALCQQINLSVEEI